MMLSPVITETERAFSEKFRARVPREHWDNPVGQLKDATGLRYDVLAAGGYRLVISHCEIVKGMPRYNARTVHELIGVFGTKEALHDACIALREHMTGTSA